MKLHGKTNRVMETGDHFKNGASLKSRMSRGKSFKFKGIITPMMLCIVMIVATTACGNKNKKEKEIQKAVFEATGINVEDVTKAKDNKTEKDNQLLIVQSKEGKENEYLIFEDERKTFEVYACWQIKTFAKKNAYGEEIGKYYVMDKQRTKVVNKTDKQLEVIQIIDRFGQGMRIAWVEPNSTSYGSSFLYMGWRSTKFNEVTGEAEILVADIGFSFFEKK